MRTPRPGLHRRRLPRRSAQPAAPAPASASSLSSALPEDPDPPGRHPHRHAGAGELPATWLYHAALPTHPGPASSLNRHRVAAGDPDVTSGPQTSSEFGLYAFVFNIWNSHVQSVRTPLIRVLTVTRRQPRSVPGTRGRSPCRPPRCQQWPSGSTALSEQSLMGTRERAQVT